MALPGRTPPAGAATGLICWALHLGRSPESFGVVGSRLCHSSVVWVSVLSCCEAGPCCGVWGGAAPRHPEGTTGQGVRAERGGREDFVKGSGGVTRHSRACSRQGLGGRQVMPSAPLPTGRSQHKKKGSGKSADGRAVTPPLDKSVKAGKGRSCCGEVPRSCRDTAPNSRAGTPERGDR